MGALVRGQMHFWNEFYAVLLETYGKRDGGTAGRRALHAAQRVQRAERGVGRDRRRPEHEHLRGRRVRARARRGADHRDRASRSPPQYIGFHLANLWGESLDYANHQTSLNGFQAERDADGVLRYVIAHRDPGVPNWLDTTGHREGFLAPRWAYSEQPPPEQLADDRARRRCASTRSARTCRPACARCPPQSARERIRVRQAHVQRRYRVF